MGDAEEITALTLPSIALADPQLSSSAERRWLTVLFCDLVDSTELSELLDPEAYLTLLRSYELTVSTLVESHGGVVAKHLGDGLLVWFGYPQAREGDAREAVATALEAVAAVEELPNPKGHPLRARVGIHCGEVVVGEIGEGRRDPLDVVGRAPNVAARIQSEARPGEVLITGAIRTRLGSAFQVRALGQTRLKGVESPVPLFRVEGVGQRQSRFQLSAGADLTPLVGRQGELATLLAAFRRAQLGESVLVQLVGSAGIGKSRLGQVLQLRLGSAARWIELDASPSGATTPYAPLLDLVPPAAQLANSQLEAGETSQGRRVRLRELLLEAMNEPDEARTTVIVGEDVHWMDPSTRELLSELHARGSRNGRLVLLLCRPPVPPQAEGVIELGPLSREDSAALLRAIPGAEALGRSRIDRILGSSDGVPLFLEEHARAVIDGNVEGLPASLTELVAARLDELGEDRIVAQVAACVGRSFDLETLAQVTEWERPALLTALDRMVAQGLLLVEGTQPEETWLFRHALLSDAAKGMLLRSQRRPLHARIARHLAARQSERPELAAPQFADAGEYAEAARAWVASARASVAASANEEAIRQSKRGMQLLPQIPGEVRNRLELELLSARAPALLGARGYTSAETGGVLDRLRMLARELEEPEALLVAVNASWTYHGVRGELDRALELVQELRVLAPAQNLPTFAFQAAGLDRLWRGRPLEALAIFDEGAEEYDPGRQAEYLALGGQDPGVGCLILGAVAAQFLEDDSGARDRLARGEGLAADIGNPHSQVFAGQVSVWLASLRGDEAGCCRLAERVAVKAREEGLPFWAAMAVPYAEWARIRQGEARTTRRLRKAIGEFAATGDGATLPWLWFLLVDAERSLGHVAEASRMAADYVDKLSGAERWFGSELRGLASEGDD
ncbi:MAG: AAA family ATPase [Deltaproteobacteria bacterium]|nr:AAA family ATPase [Deltaproteobacteria bacterium]